ncbi:MAG TPA: hypothetical protein VKV15_11290 [Bryobacteraceae bacterium]|nr:hypothetical protein [Bryobacteraceae bacterium]
MKYFSPRIALVMALGVGLSAFLLSSQARADQWNKLTTLTVNQPTQVQDKVLQPGQYVFKLADSSSDRHIVQIFNRDQTQIIDTVLAIPNYRLHPTGDSRFAFWETPPGAAKALRAWFYPGDNFGQEFQYPKHLAMLNTSSPAVAPPPAPASAPREQTPPPAPAPAPQQSMTQPVQPQEPPAQVAQNNPTAETPAPVAQNTRPAPQAEPQLPKTASPYPLFGFAGLFSFGLYALLRLKRVS